MLENNVYKRLKDKFFGFAQKKYIQQIFSVNNSTDKVHKIIIIFGIKFKVRNKEKEFQAQLDREIHAILDRKIHAIEQQDIKAFCKNFYKNYERNIDIDKYKNNAIIFNYRFIDIMQNWGVNLGDYIQSIAVDNVLNIITPNVNKVYHDRDSLSVYNNKPAFTIMQGWFSQDYNFMPNDMILPIWIGTHISPHMKNFVEQFIYYNRNYFNGISVGCRDEDTKNFFYNLGINAYKSRCLTLTLPRREILNSQNKIFIVNLPDEYLKYIPCEILKNANFINQRCIDGHQKTVEYFNSQYKYSQQANELLEKYRKEAKLIITSALHCASPCTAMGIPVVLIAPNEDDTRFSALDGILKIYSKKDLTDGNVDYNLVAPDIENLKKLMIRNVELSIKQTFEENINIEELSSIRQQIEQYKIV